MKDQDAGFRLPDEESHQTAFLRSGRDRKNIPHGENSVRCKPDADEGLARSARREVADKLRIGQQLSESLLHRHNESRQPGERLPRPLEAGNGKLVDRNRTRPLRLQYSPANSRAESEDLRCHSRLQAPRTS